MNNKQLPSLNPETAFLDAINSQEPVTGLTHNFYYYPARFSPLLARAAIELFTKPGDIVFDPFVGGGTTVVEAQYLGRSSVGLDINNLAIMISRVKTTPLSPTDVEAIKNWFAQLPAKLNLRNSTIRPTQWIENGYQRNISNRKTWPIRKTLELALAHIDELRGIRQQEFARCVLLKTGQWAIHRRRKLPSAQEFRLQLLEFLDEMLEGIKAFSERLNEQYLGIESEFGKGTICLNGDARHLERVSFFQQIPAPKLILTSPPYPGVHALYHRWQVDGRKETPVAYWIANCLDGQGASFYTLGGRQQAGLSDYFDNIEKVFSSLAKISDNNTIFVQVIGFSDPSWQLPTYLSALNRSGFDEIKYTHLADSPDGRLWRKVPNRKWYVYRPGTIESSKEVVLVHRRS